MGKRSAFTGKLDDIDDILPSAPLLRTAEPIEFDVDDAAADRSAPSTSVDSQAAGAAGELRSVSVAETKPRRRQVGPSAPTVQIDSAVHKKLRRLTRSESIKNPTTARTYAAVVLDAIEANVDVLAHHWQPQSTGSTGMFSRRKATPVQRRRHIDPPMRIPLAGMNAEDLAVLDGLVIEWNAGSKYFILSVIL